MRDHARVDCIGLGEPSGAALVAAAGGAQMRLLWRQAADQIGQTVWIGSEENAVTSGRASTSTRRLDTSMPTKRAPAGFFHHPSSSTEARARTTARAYEERLAPHAPQRSREAADALGPTGRARKTSVATPAEN
jgi:hypothetical protein